MERKIGMNSSNNFGHKLFGLKDLTWNLAHGSSDWHAMKYDPFLWSDN